MTHNSACSRTFNQDRPWLSVLTIVFVRRTGHHFSWTLLLLTLVLENAWTLVDFWMQIKQYVVCECG